MKYDCSFVLSTIVALVLISSAHFSLAQVSTSNNYQIYSDSVNFGGGFSTSTSFLQEATFGEVATGRGTSTSYNLFAGYQQMQEVFLSLTNGSDVTLSPNIGGVTGGTSYGSSSVVAVTDSPSGYQLTIAASDAPAMRNATSSIPDYVPAGIAADTIFTTGDTDAHFGFSPFGVDVADRYLVAGGVCGSGSASSTACWDGLSTTTKIIANATGSNHPVGATTTIYFRVGVGSAVNQADGLYTATTTITMLSL